MVEPRNCLRCVSRLLGVFLGSRLWFPLSLSRRGWRWMHSRTTSLAALASKAMIGGALLRTSSVGATRSRGGWRVTSCSSTSTLMPSLAMIATFFEGLCRAEQNADRSGTSKQVVGDHVHEYEMR